MARERALLVFKDKAMIRENAGKKIIDNRHTSTIIMKQRWQVMRFSRYKLIRCRAQARERSLFVFEDKAMIRESVGTRARARTLARGNELLIKGKRSYVCESEAQPIFKNSKICCIIVFPRKVLFYL